MAFAQYMLNQNYTYREIQITLKKKYGSGLSNTKLKELQEHLTENAKLRAENQKLQQELHFFKNLYFELLDTMKKKL